MLINYEDSHDQEVFPHGGCRGSQLDFVVTSDNRNLIDLNKIILELECAIYKADCKAPEQVMLPVCFTNNTLQSLFSHAELFLNGILISSSSNACHHSSFVKTEMTTDLDAKAHWPKPKATNIKPTKVTKKVGISGMRRRLAMGKRTKTSKQAETCWGAAHRHFECEKVLLPMVMLHLRLQRSSSDFVDFDEPVFTGRN